jgi:putative two-component system response regulator
MRGRKMKTEISSSIHESILVVDDTPDNLALMSVMLSDKYNVRVANNGEKALRIARSAFPPDLILLDIMMEPMDGYEVCRQLKSDTKTNDIPVIFLTARSEIEDEKKGLALGAVDYIIKPISPSIAMARISTHLQLKSSADFLKDKNAYLETQVANRTKDIIDLQEVTILTLATLAETRDAATGHHIRRTKLYIQLLAKAMQKQPFYSSILTDQMIDIFVKSAPLHDIGKVGIPDNILLKPGRLTPAEFEIMQRHTTIGQRAIENAECQLKKKVEFLQYAKEIAHSHHEKWDGSGYPEGLKGEAIPLSARLMAVADVYDALVSARVYKVAMSHEKAMEIIMEGRGTQFDPNIVDTFQRLNPEFRAISERYSDNEE